MASSSSLGIRYISILKSSVESPSSSGSLFYQNRNQQQQKKTRIVARGCSASSIHHNNNRRAAVASSGSSSTTNAYSDTVFGTELKKKKQRQQEIMVGVDDDDDDEEKKKKVSPQISADKLDEWMAFSVPEIVKNIGDAPLLVHIYSSMSKRVHGLSSIGSPSSSSSSSSPANPIPIIEKTKADAKSWTGVTKRWEEGSQIPDGIILVEQLEAEDGGGSTKTWGVVIQGRGAESASSCYILKTCRVGSSLGFCTHFCLARAKCFGESADLQLKNSWLLGH